MDLAEIDAFASRLNYLSFNGRFHLLTNGMAASTSSSLFDIIVTMYYHRRSHHRYCR